LGNETITDRTRALAERSANCVVCQCARRQQAGLAFWVVKTFEGLCPFCRAYEKVYGRKSHEPLPAATPEPGPHAATAHSPQQVVEPNPSTKL
jgi:hypothetical protein